MFVLGACWYRFVSFLLYYKQKKHTHNNKRTNQRLQQQQQLRQEKRNKDRQSQSKRRNMSKAKQKKKVSQMQRKRMIEDVFKKGKKQREISKKFDAKIAQRQGNGGSKKKMYEEKKRVSVNLEIWLFKVAFEKHSSVHLQIFPLSLSLYLGLSLFVSLSFFFSLALSSFLFLFRYILYLSVFVSKCITN